ncbi:hypothetical protein [Shewanella marina]|uniref:hypothetical protein n=1 Tax=Shewanella marina TaxID=487319 RepID=UPI000472687E|nr:hypothetical protein [Shewanella marina]
MKKSILALVLSSLLFGCGGSDGESSSPEVDPELPPVVDPEIPPVVDPLPPVTGKLVLKNLNIEN